MTPSALGQVLRYARKKAGLSQDSLAYLTNAAIPNRTITKAQIGNWERGVSMPNAATYLTALEECGYEFSVRPLGGIKPGRAG